MKNVFESEGEVKVVCSECHTQTVTGSYGAWSYCHICTKCGRIVRISDWGIKILRRARGYWWEVST